MYDKTCFFGCKRYWECPQGKPSEDTKCDRFDPKEGYELKVEAPNKIDFEKLLGIPVEIEDE